MDTATNEKDKDGVAKPVQRKRFARAKLGRILAPAKAAMEKAQQKPQETASKLATSAPSNVDMTSASFKPDTIAVEVANESAAAAANLESVIKKRRVKSILTCFGWILPNETVMLLLVFGKQGTNGTNNGKWQDHHTIRQLLCDSQEQ
jgi:hypothetical protein